MSDAEIDVLTSDERKRAGEIVWELLAAIDGLGVDPQTRSDLHAEAETIQAQLKTHQPRAPIIGECLREIAERLEPVAASDSESEGGILAAAILKQIRAFLDRRR